MDRNIRWSANYYMLKRYFELKPYFAAYNGGNGGTIQDVLVWFEAL
jgi:hypothetical protein